MAKLSVCTDTRFIGVLQNVPERDRLAALAGLNPSMASQLEITRDDPRNICKLDNESAQELIGWITDPALLTQIIGVEKRQSVTQVAQRRLGTLGSEKKVARGETVNRERTLRLVSKGPANVVTDLSSTLELCGDTFAEWVAGLSVSELGAYAAPMIRAALAGKETSGGRIKHTSAAAAVLWFALERLDAQSVEFQSVLQVESVSELFQLNAPFERQSYMDRNPVEHWTRNWAEFWASSPCYTNYDVPAKATADSEALSALRNPIGQQRPRWDLISVLDDVQEHERQQLIQAVSDAIVDDSPMANSIILATRETAFVDTIVAAVAGRLLASATAPKGSSFSRAVGRMTHLERLFDRADLSDDTAHVVALTVFPWTYASTWLQGEREHVPSEALLRRVGPQLPVQTISQAFSMTGHRPYDSTYAEDQSEKVPPSLRLLYRVLAECDPRFPNVVSSSLSHRRWYLSSYQATDAMSVLTAEYLYEKLGGSPGAWSTFRSMMSGEVASTLDDIANASKLLNA